MNRTAALFAFGAALFASNPGHSATLLWDPTVDACTSLNCGAPAVNGTVANVGGVSTIR